MAIALSIAAARGHLPVVEALLATGKLWTLEARDEHDRTALWLAASKGHAAVVEGLLAAGADASAVAEAPVQWYGRECSGTVLLAAIDGGHHDVIEVLMSSELCGDLEVRDEQGRTALWLAAHKGYAALVRGLLAADADASAVAEAAVLWYGRPCSGTVLLAAIEAGHQDVVEVLLSSELCGDLEVRDGHSQTALWLAASKGYAAAVKGLLAAGADASAVAEPPVQSYGRECSGTVLHAAIEAGHQDVVEVLLSSELCGDLEVRDGYGRTALWLAASKGYAAAVKGLLAAGADGSAVAEPPVQQHGRSYSGTVLLAAIEAGHQDVVEVLVSSGRRLDLEVRDEHGRTVLWLAASQGRAAVVTALLQAGAETTTVPRRRQRYQRYVSSRHTGTALVAAVYGGHSETVYALLSFGWSWDLEATDEKDGTMLSLAASRGENGVVQRLLDAGADPAASVGRRQPIVQQARGSARPLIESAIAAGPARRMANLRWHREGRRRLVMWRRAVLVSSLSDM